MTRTWILIAFATLLGSFGFYTLAQPTAAPVPTADTLAKAALDGYAKAINDKNHDAIASYWADAAEHIGDDGVTTTGKANITAMFKKTLTDNPKLTVKLAPKTSRLVGNDVLLVDGTAEIVNGDDTDVCPFESIWVRSGTSWQLSRVRELPTPTTDTASNFDYLKELEWFVGDWTSEQATYSVNLNVQWVKNKNFLRIDQVVKADGKESVSVTKLIGYDPIRGQLRSWVFDSDGGYGGALIRRSGNVWIEESESVTRTAGEATATHTSKFLDDNSFEWSSTERQLDDRPLPDVKIKYTRKPITK